MVEEAIVNLDLPKDRLIQTGFAFRVGKDGTAEIVNRFSLPEGVISDARKRGSHWFLVGGLAGTRKSELKRRWAGVVLEDADL